MLKSFNLIIIISISILLTACSCKEPNIILDKKLNQEDLSHVDTIEYIYISAPLSPENHRKQIITITQSSIVKKEYSHYGQKLISKNVTPIVPADFKKIKELLHKYNIGMCNCYVAETLVSMRVGCSSESLSLYDDKKEIYSEYASCNQGRLCGNYKKFIEALKHYSTKLSSINNNQLLNFATSKLKLNIKNLKLQRYQKHIQKNHNWAVKKDDEALVRDTSKLTYNYFRLYKT